MKGLKTLKPPQLCFVLFSLWGGGEGGQTMELIVLSGCLKNSVAWGGAVAYNASGNYNCVPWTAVDRQT